MFPGTDEICLNILSITENKNKRNALSQILYEPYSMGKFCAESKFSSRSSGRFLHGQPLNNKAIFLSLTLLSGLSSMQKLVKLTIEVKQREQRRQTMNRRTVMITQQRKTSQVFTPRMSPEQPCYWFSKRDLEHFTLGSHPCTNISPMS